MDRAKIRSLGKRALFFGVLSILGVIGLMTFGLTVEPGFLNDGNYADDLVLYGLTILEIICGPLAMFFIFRLMQHDPRMPIYKSPNN